VFEESVGQLLLAGFLPGIVSAVIYGLIIVSIVSFKPDMGPKTRIYSFKEKIVSLPSTVPIFSVIIIIFGAMYFGWATPTEAGALGAFVVFIIAVLKGMKASALKAALYETAKLTVMIFSIIWGVLVYVRFLGFAGLPNAFSNWITSLDYPPLAILLCILLVYAILGMFMDAIGMLLLTLPVVQPAVIALGYDPIWFGIIVVKMAELCLITPPIGLNCFVVNGAQPLKTSCTGISGRTPLTTKQFKPIGGVIRQSSAILTTIIPNQMGSYPNAMTAGCTTGKVSSNIPIASINMPKMA
jgi:TRAP-type C4-dicarboxylate transport system permease large subunit